MGDVSVASPLRGGTGRAEHRGPFVRLMRMRPWWTAAMVLSACSPASPEPAAQPSVVVAATSVDPAPEPVTATEPFEDVARAFAGALASGDPARIDAFFAPPVAVIHNPGAFPLLFDIRSIAEILPRQGNGILYELPGPCELLRGPQPSYSCDGEGWTTDAECVFGHDARFGAADVVRGLAEAGLCDGPEAGACATGAVDAAAQLDCTATHFLYFTRVDTGFFFGVVDGAWRVVAIDRIDPCSA